MLTLWLPAADIRVPPAAAETVRLGSGLEVVREPSDVEAAAEAWLVPAGLALKAGLVEAAVASGRPTLVTINGLGDKAVAALSGRGGGSVTLVFDATGIETLALAEQLAWLQARTTPFAVVVSEPAQAMLATLAGASALLLDDDPLLVATVLRVAAAGRPHGPRPVSPEEVDGIDGREVCLTVTEALPAGAVVERRHLAVAQTDSRGLSPILADRVAGLTLAYPIAPGEPLHFAHFKDPAP